jgi:pimeloyl-ACP methyl ester carboxylesterase
MPDVDRVRLEDVGHWPQLEDAQTVRAHLERILTV